MPYHFCVARVWFPGETGQMLVGDGEVSSVCAQAVHMAHYLMRHEGLFVGSSSAMNVVAAVRYPWFAVMLLH